MQHPLGFFHLRVLSEGALSVRVHYWPADARPASSAVTPYHDHVWSLESCVLAGTIENVLLDLAEDAAGAYSVADIVQVDGVDRVVPRPERVRIAGELATTHRRGEFYEIRPSQFHYTRIAGHAAAATIVRAEVVVAGGPRTLVPAGYAGQAPTRSYLSESDAERVLIDLDQLLS